MTIHLNTANARRREADRKRQAKRRGKDATEKRPNPRQVADAVTAAAVDLVRERKLSKAAYEALIQGTVYHLVGTGRDPAQAYERVVSAFTTRSTDTIRRMRESYGA